MFALVWYLIMPSLCRRSSISQSQLRDAKKPADSMSARNMTAVALADTPVLVIRKSQLGKYLRKYPNMRDAILKSLGHNMEASLRRVKYLKSVTEDKLRILVSLFNYVPLQEVGFVLFCWFLVFIL